MSEQNTTPPQLTEQEAELLSAYLDNMLSAQESVALETRLQGEPWLRAELDAMRQTVLWLNQMPTFKAPRNFTLSPADAGLEQKPQNITPLPQEKPRIMHPRRWTYLATAAAAVFVILLGVGVILPNLNMPSFLSDADIAQGAPAEVAILATRPAEPPAPVTQSDSAGAGVANNAPQDSEADDALNTRTIAEAEQAEAGEEALADDGAAFDESTQLQAGEETVHDTDDVVAEVIMQPTMTALASPQSRMVTEDALGESAERQTIIPTSAPMTTFSSTNVTETDATTLDRADTAESAEPDGVGADIMLYDDNVQTLNAPEPLTLQDLQRATLRLFAFVLQALMP